jgi:hypothetical protein
VNSGAAYNGSLIDLQVNSASRFKVDQAGNTTLGGTLTVNGASITGPASGAFSIDNGNGSALSIGGTNATTLNLGRSGQTQALLGNATVAGTLGVSGATTLSSTLGVTGNTTLSGTLTGPSAATFTIDTGGAAGVNALNIGGNSSGMNIGRAGTTQALLGSATVAGTLNVAGNFSVATNRLVINAGTGAITGPTTAAAQFSIDNGNASAINIGGTTATTLNLGRSGQTQALLGNATVAGTLGVTGNTTLSGTLGVTGATTLSSTLGVTGNTTLGGTLTGPSAAAFSIDAGGAQNINIGGTTATTLNLGRSGQTQALLGNATVAGTLTTTGQENANGGLRIGTAGTPILEHYSATTSWDVANTAAQACASTTVAVTGAALGDMVTYNWTNTVGGIESFINSTGWFEIKAWVSAADTVKIQVCNRGTSNSNPALQTWRVDVWGH